jgi:hypothetical protein
LRICVVEGQRENHNVSALCRFRFTGRPRRELIEAGIVSAIFNAECFFGKPKVAVSGVGYYLSRDGRHLLIDISSDVGQHVAQIFTGIMINTLGEDTFQVKRIEGESVSARGNERS